MKQRTALRKAAILISALETEAADRLLEQMGEEQAAQVRNAILNLGDISDEEQEAALSEFFGQRPATADVAWEVSPEAIALAEGTSSSNKHSYSGGGASLESKSLALPFDFLNAVPLAVLHRFFQQEHPQTIALIIAQMSAEQGAALLRSFSTQVCQEIVDRLQSGGEADAEILAEIEQSLRKVFAPYIRAHEMSPQRRDHIQAILNKLQPPVVPEPESAVVSPIVAPEMAPAAELPEEHGDESLSEILSDDSYDDILELSPESEYEQPTMEFEQLLSFSTEHFFAVFEAADSRLTMLALAGASRRLFERYVAQFSTERATEFERHLEQLRPFSLSDVAFAQQELAKIAVQQQRAATFAAENSHLITAEV